MTSQEMVELKSFFTQHLQQQFAENNAQWDKRLTERFAENDRQWKKYLREQLSALQHQILLQMTLTAPVRFRPPND